MSDNKNNSVFGEVSWDTDMYSNSEKKNVNNKDLWLRLDAGTNEVRLVTQPYQYLVHKYKKPEDKGFGQKVYCSAIHGSCPLCAVGDKAKTRWLLGVISRKTGKYQILDVSWAILSQIKKLNKNPKFGDPTKYDINIEVDKNGGATGYYSIQGYPKEPLSAPDQAIKDAIDFDYLKQKVTPPSPEQVQKRLDAINGATGSVPMMGASQVKTAAPVSQDDDEDELGTKFPDYSSKSAEA